MNIKTDIKNIVVGVDLSDPSRIALEQAARLANWNGAKLRVVHVVRSNVVKNLALHEGRGFDDIRTELTQVATETLEAWCGKLSEPKHVSFRVRYGHAVAEMVKQIKETNADLLVSGVRGLTGNLTTSGADSGKLARSTPCGMLLVDTQTAVPFRRILVGVDDSKASKEAVHYALNFSQMDASEVMFVNICAPAAKRYPHFSNGANLMLDCRFTYLTDIKDTWHRLGGPVKPNQVSFFVHHSHEVGHGLIEFATQKKADLLIIGKHGSNLMHERLFGSTAQYLLRHQSCSLLAVRPDDPIGADSFVT